MKYLLITLMLLNLSSSSIIEQVALKQNSIGQQCDNSINAFTVTTFSVVPFPPQRGSPLTRIMSGVFNSNQTITGIQGSGYIYGQHYFFLNEFFPSKGNFTVGQTISIQDVIPFPSNAPSGFYTFIGGIVNSNSQSINCWTVSFSLA
ncbi:hypothetical protein SteCoe_38207 [Stentor coeruleus]|uniref:Reelin domain-containing protein n=1 Tax=Stentor coeruleus TaxID=5963 RepID=A0A1R2ALS8_9CILI|nr:hypothetical protein SteCoe_38207 [Stentor coeruleus]